MMYPKFLLMVMMLMGVTITYSNATFEQELQEALGQLEQYIEKMQGTMCFIKVHSFGKNKQKVMKALREVVPFEHLQEKDFLEIVATFPLPREEAQSIKMVLEQAGATVVIIEEKVNAQK